MNDIRVHVLHTGQVCVAPDLPFGGKDCGIIRASGVFARKEDRIWLPVSCYLIEHPRGLLLVDTGWDRSISPKGTLDKQSQIASLGSRLLYATNQGVLPLGQSVAEQLAERWIAAADLDYVLLTHLDCDHANGLAQVKDAKHILVSADELASVRKGFAARIRYQARWWEQVKLEPFSWNGEEGPHGRSFDVFGDASVVCVGIPGHAAGLFAVKVTGEDGRFVLLTSDGAYGRRSWEDMVLPGIGHDRAAQEASLAWIAKQARSEQCFEVLATHDPDVYPHIVVLPGVAQNVPKPSAQPDPPITLDDFKQAAGKTAVATALAGTIAAGAAALTPDQLVLPDAVPIVQTIDIGGGSDLPDDNATDDIQKDRKASAIKTIFKVLKYAILALFVVASFVFGILQGCASCAGPLVAPTDDVEQQQQSQSQEEEA